MALLRDELEDAAVQPPLHVARVGHLKDHRVGDLEVRQLLEGPAIVSTTTPSVAVLSARFSRHQGGHRLWHRRRRAGTGAQAIEQPLAGIHAANALRLRLRGQP